MVSAKIFFAIVTSERKTFYPTTEKAFSSTVFFIVHGHNLYCISFKDTNPKPSLLSPLTARILLYLVINSSARM
ncbi:MAG TPA: hypothetical protein VFT71_00410 [Candidatus Nitrosocosmicus sp.]|nr:hypothetical protein [Candidatus Nitrosocosmicus sp.]